MHKNACFVHRLPLQKDSVHKNACFVHRLPLPEVVSAIDHVASVKNVAKIVTRDIESVGNGTYDAASVKNPTKIVTRDT